MNREKADKLLRKWKRILRMEEWTIKLIPDAIPDDMALRDVDGEAIWVECKKTAVIRILRQDCYGDRIQAYNFERILVHELLHLKLCLLGESGNDLQDRYVHQLIDDLARAFVEANNYDEHDE